MASAASSSHEPPAPAGAARPAPSQAPPDLSGVFNEEQEEALGGYQWRFLWLGVVPSNSPIFAPAGESQILGHHGIVAWAQPDDDEVDPPLPLGELVRSGGTSVRMWGASHVVQSFSQVRGFRSELALPGHEEFVYSLDAMAVTMRVWPGNAYRGIGDTMRLLVMAVKPSPSAPAGHEDTQEALHFANREMLAWMRRTLQPWLRAERAREPRLLLHTLCAGTFSIQNMLQDEVGQHVCHAVSGPVQVGRSHVGVGSGIMAIGPHVKIGGRYADPHAWEEDEDEAGWPMLPGPMRTSYSEAHGMWYPALFLGQSRRMRAGQREKKRGSTAS